MGILNYLLIFLIIIFPIAELGKIQSGSISISLNDIALFITASVWFLLDYKKIKKTKFKLFTPILFFVLIGFFSLIFNISNLNLNEFFVSFLYLARWILYSFLYFILITRDKKFIKKFKNILLIPISTVLIIGIIQYFYYPSLRNLFYLGWDEHLYRLFGGFLDPNFAGAFLVISLMYLSFLSHQAFVKKQKNLFLLTLTLSCFTFISIYLTYSRSALIMLLVSFTVFLVLIKKLRLLIFLLIPFLIFIFISPKAFQTEGTNLFRVFSTQARIESAQIAIDIIGENPIFGVGFNSYRYAQNKYANLSDSKWETTHSGAGTDNSFLFVAATTGIIGFLIYIYLIYKIYYLARTQAKNPLSIILISVLSGLLVNSLFINSLFYVFILEWLWILAALTENS